MAEAEVRERRGVSPIWLVPIVALLLGAYLVVSTYRNQGPAVTIIFASAEGIEAEKTKIRFRNVVVGVVEAVRLSEDLSGVAVETRLDKQVEPLLREGTRFWVVRPRIGASGVSGLGTLLSGAYIEFAPGSGEPDVREFVGLDELPVTPAGVDGLHLELVSDQAGSVSTGSPILYRGFKVGRIESARFDVETKSMRYGAFIDAPYDDLVNTSTRFWNASGISVAASADGVEVKTGSLETILAGGVSFGLPGDVRAGGPVSPGARFSLYESYVQVNERPYRKYAEYVLEFNQSVRGLRMGAPVEYRGIRVGTVVEILLEERVDDERFGSGLGIPVLVRLEPGRLELGDTPEGLERLVEAIEQAVSEGMRATLATSNLLTGGRYVSLEMHPNEPAAALGEFAGKPTIPTLGSGLEGLQTRLATLLDKLNALPLDGVVGTADATLARLDQTLASLDGLLASEAMQQVPESLQGSLAQLERTLATLSPDSPLVRRLAHTLTELERTLARLDGLATTLSEKPNALIFPIRSERDPEPPAGAP